MSVVFCTDDDFPCSRRCKALQFRWSNLASKWPEHGLKWTRPGTKLYPRGPGTLSGQTVQPSRAGVIAPLGHKILPKQTTIWNRFFSSIVMACTGFQHFPVPVAWCINTAILLSVDTTIDYGIQSLAWWPFSDTHYHAITYENTLSVR